MTKQTESKLYELIMNGNLWDDNPNLLFEVSYDDRDFDYFKLDEGKSVLRDWPDNFVINVTGTTLVDYFYCGAYYKVVSNKAKEVFEKFSHTIEFLPIHINHENLQRTIPHYWVINILEVLDVLDWENTFWTTSEIPYNDPDAHMSIIRPALKREKINNEIFHITVNKQISSSVFITDKVRKELISANARLGMSFLPTKTT